MNLEILAQNVHEQDFWDQNWAPVFNGERLRRK